MYRMITRSVMLLLSILLVGCSNQGLPSFDQTSLDNAQRLKNSSLNLIAKSSGLSSGADYQLQINLLDNQLRRAVEHAASMKNNAEALSSWQDLLDEVMGPFLEYWQRTGNIQPAARDEFALQVQQAFDSLICIEQNKRASTPCPELSTPNS